MRQEVEAGDPLMLSLCRAIADFTLATDTERILEGMVGLSLVEPDLGAATRAVQNLALSGTNRERYAARRIAVGSLSGRNPSCI